MLAESGVASKSPRTTAGPSPACSSSDRERGAASLLLTLELERKRPIWLVVRNDQRTESGFHLDDQGGTPWKVFAMLRGPLVDLLQHSMLCTSCERRSSVVLAGGGKRSNAVTRAQQVFDPTPDVNLLKCDHVRF